MGGASRRAVVRCAAGVPSGALGKRAGEAVAAVCVFPVWRRAEAVHRKHVRADGSERDARDDRPEVPTGLGAWAGREADGVHYDATEERDPREAGSARLVFQIGMADGTRGAPGGFW